MRERRRTSPAMRGGDWSSCALFKVSPRIGGRMTRTKVKVLDATERSRAIKRATLREFVSIRRKAKNYAVFGGPRFVSEDLFHDALMDAFDGRPAWRVDCSIVDYCDEVMARRVGFFRRLKSGSGQNVE